MKKYFTILLFLCCAIPLTVYAAEMLNTQNSFQLARAVKLGRGQTNPAFLGSDFVPPETHFVQQCAEHCSSCNQENGVCSGCDTGYTLQNNKCILASCPAGKYLNGSECSSCSSAISGCSTCTSATNCTLCSSSYFLSNGNCVTCPSGYTCNGKDAVCTRTCSAGQYLTSSCTCTACPTGCTSCTGANECSACASGYHLKNGVCVANCTGVTCASGANPVSGDKNCCCVAETPTIANCATQSGSTCTKCNSGYYLSGNTCVSCPSNATCTGTSTFTCSSGYYKNGSSCSKCSSGCSACTSSTNCTACSSGTLVNGSCVDDCDYWSIAYNSCSQGYRKPKSGGSCEKCPANTQCGTCPSGCTGSTAGTCQKIGNGTISCFMCATHEIVYDCTCPTGYKRSLDGTTCLSDTGAPQMCSYY